MKNGDALTFNGSSLVAPLPKILSRFAIGLGCVFFVTAVIGAFQSFSPVPFWDMWDGYLLFYVRVTNGDYAAWWGQHVDHRIIFSNLLFWLDFRLFDGKLWFLIAANYLLLLCIWLTMSSIAIPLLPGKELSASRNLYLGVTLALQFSWIQKENLAWAFQSGMFAAILFPMLTFVLFYRAEITTGRRSTLYFLLSLLAGVVSAGTMLNGLAALPILAVLGILFKTSRIRVGLTAVLAIGIVALYFHGFAAPNSTVQSSIFKSLLVQPLSVMTFFLAQIGAPAHYIFKNNLWAAVVTGSLVLLWFCWFTVASLRRPIKNKAVFVILALSLYTILTSFGIAGSRIISGVDYAFTSRYMTNVLSLWTALILLFLHSCPLSSRYRSGLFTLVLIIPLALLPNQLPALERDANELTNRLVAALALELGVQDEDQIKHVFPWMDIAFILAKTPVARNLSIFGNPLIRDAATSLMTIDQHEGAECLGNVEAIEALPGEHRFSKLSTWLMDSRSHETPKVFYVLNSERKIIGYGLGGFARDGLTDSRQKFNSGGLAYVITEALTEDITLQGRDVNCKVVARRPDMRFFFALSQSDVEWENGVAKDWGPALLLKPTPSIRQTIQEQVRLRLADGSIRRITKIEERDRNLILFLDGSYLRGELIGYPKKIEILGK